jgi:energy-coupling factor transporter transmembrane protein EcfT
MVIALAGTFIVDRWLALAIAVAVVAVLLARAGLARVFLIFILTILGPTWLMLLLAWGLIVRAAPGEVMGTDPGGGAVYATMIALRLALLGGVIQLGMLSVPPRLLPVTLRGWGIKGDGLVVALGVFAVGPELLLRAEQVATARKARGLAQRGVTGQLREITRMLRPLFVWSIRSAVHRSEAWQQRAILLKVDQLPFAENEFWPAGGVIAVVLSVAWLATAVASRFL